MSPGLSNHQQLTWISHDTQYVVTALVKSQLDQWSKECSISVQQVSSQPVTKPKQTFGLAIWAIWQINELAPTLAMISAWRHHRQRPKVILVYLAPSLSSHSGLIVEAGASLVVHQIYQLQNVLQSLQDRLPLGNSTGNGLTQGLDHLLPWKPAKPMGDQDY